MSVFQVGRKVKFYKKKKKKIEKKRRRRRSSEAMTMTELMIFSLCCQQLLIRNMCIFPFLSSPSTS